MRRVILLINAIVLISSLRLQQDVTPPVTPPPLTPPPTNPPAPPTNPPATTIPLPSNITIPANITITVSSNATAPASPGVPLISPATNLGNMTNMTNMTNNMTNNMTHVDQFGQIDLPFGKILVDPFGYSLYAFDRDRNNQSRCYGPCASRFPPVLVKDLNDLKFDSSLNQKLFGMVDRMDGMHQLTFNNFPLYYYSKDTVPGDFFADGSLQFGDYWWILDSNGNKLTDVSFLLIN